MSTVNINNKTISIKEVKSLKLTYQEKHIKIPLYISMSGLIEYEEVIEENNDYRKAFCKLLLEQLKYYPNQENIIDFESFEDNKLLEIMKNILSEDNYLGKYFSENDWEYSFENFYLAYKKQQDITKEQFSKIFSPLIDFSKTMEPIQNYTKNLFKPFKELQNTTLRFANISNAYKFANSNPQLLNMKPPQLKPTPISMDFNFKSPVAVTNELLEESNNIAKKHLQNNVEILQKIEIEESNRTIADKKLNKKQLIHFIINLIIGLLGLGIAIVSFIGYDRIKLLFK